MAVPKRKKCKSKACIRLNYIKYKKINLLKSKKIMSNVYLLKNSLNYFKKQKYYLI